MLKQVAAPSPPMRGTDSLGAFTSIEAYWGMGVHTSAVSGGGDAPLLVTSIRAYDTGETIAFRQRWPKGDGAGRVGGDANSVIAPFPSFNTNASTTMTSQGHRDIVDQATRETLNFLQFGGCQLANTFTGRWTNASSVPSGERVGIPLALYSRSGRTAVLGPAGNWFTTVNAGVHGGVGCGIKTTVASLPPGFTHDTLLVAGHGINHTLVAYGDALLTRSGKRRPKRSDDFVLSHLGYWTDVCLCARVCRLRSLSLALRIPFRSLVLMCGAALKSHSL